MALRFGIVAMTAGLIGVPLGSYLAQRIRPYHANCDPLICAAGLLISAPFVYLGLVTAKYSATWCFIMVFFAEVALNLCWSIVADIVLVSTAAAGCPLIVCVADSTSPSLTGSIIPYLFPNFFSINSQSFIQIWRHNHVVGYCWCTAWILSVDMFDQTLSQV
jgi:MFS transporter, Spinster family, sphingosine-1-phosphate transporter